MPGELITPEMLTQAAPAAVAVLPGVPAAPAGLTLNPATIMQYIKMVQDGVKAAQDVMAIIKQVQGMAPGVLSRTADGMGVVPVDGVKQPLGPPPAVYKADCTRPHNEPCTKPHGEATPLAIYAAVLGLVGGLQQDSKVNEILELGNLTPDSTVGEVLALLRDLKPVILAALGGTDGQVP